MGWDGIGRFYVGGWGAGVAAGWDTFGVGGGEWTGCVYGRM